MAGKFSGQLFVFDKTGQVSDSSNVIAIYGDWTPRDEDAATGFLFTHMTYDELRRLKVITHPDNNIRQYSYDGCGCAGSAETRVTDEPGHQTVSKTDFLGRLIESYEPLSGSPTDAYSKAVYIFDELDRLKEIRHSDSSGAKIQTRTFAFDGYGRLQSETTPEVGTASYTYKPNDLVETKTDQRGVVVTFGYNTRNLATSVGYNDGTPAVSFGYDQYGARQSMSDGEGSTTFSFNNFRQLESETRTFIALPNKSYILSYTYNLADQLKTVNYSIASGSGFGPLSGGSYSISGTVKNSQNVPMPGVQVRLTGSQTSLVNTNSSGQYSFTNLAAGGNYTVTPTKANYSFTPTLRTYNNLQSNITNANFTGFLNTYTISGTLRDSNNQPIPQATITLSGSQSGSVQTDGNGRRLQMGYSPQRGQPTGMTVDRTDGTDKIIDSVYDYYDGSGHNNGRIRKITDLVDGAYSMEYSYDDYNRLTNATAGPIGSPTYSRSYQYDAWGNTKNFNGVTFNYQTNPSGAPSTNRITSDSAGASFGYDNAGNMTSSPGWTFAFDGADRLKQATGGSTSTYGYDGDGMRVRQTTAGNPLYYVRSSVLGQVVMEVNSSQGVYRAYVYSGSKLLGQRSHDGNFYWVHTNHLNSARWLMDAGGFAIYRGEFDPYGQAVFEYVATSSLNSHKFTGYERDAATGLDYANARMYNSGRGRFMQPDPIGLKAADLKIPQTLNRFSYVRNDPINFIDRGGLYAESGMCVMVGFGGWEGYQWVEYRCYLEVVSIGPLEVGPSYPIQDPYQQAFNNCVNQSPSDYNGEFTSDVAGLVGISEALLAVTWGAESRFSWNPKSSPVNVLGVGTTYDVGPMQLNDYYTANDVGVNNFYNLDPYTWEQVMGSYDKGQAFNGDPHANIVLGARKLNYLLGKEGTEREAAGAYVGSDGGFGPESRKKQYDKYAPGFNKFFDCYKNQLGL